MEAISNWNLRRGYRRPAYYQGGRAVRMNKILRIAGLFAAIMLIGVEKGWGEVSSKAPRTEVLRSPWIDVRSYPSINAAVAAIGSTRTTLVVPDTQTLTGNLTIPSTLGLKILNGGSIVNAGTCTLRINGPFEAGLYQVFKGFSAGEVTFGSLQPVPLHAAGEVIFAPGDVSFGSGAVRVVYPEWWGVDGVDDKPAITKALTSISGTGGIVQLSNKTYVTKSTLYVPSNVILQGVGMRPALGSTIKGCHTGPAVVSLKGAVMVSLRFLNIHGDSVKTPQTGLALGRSTHQSAGRHYIESVNVTGYFSKAAIYSIASEENTWIMIHANVLGGGARYTFYTSEQDDLSVDNFVKSCNTIAQLFGIELLHQGNTANSAVIYMNTGWATRGWLFKGGFTGITAGPNSSHVVIHQFESGASGITFEDIGHEAWSNATPPVQVFLLDCAPGGTKTLRGLAIKNNQVGQYVGGTRYFINSTKGVKLVGADISVSYTQHPSRLNEVADSRINLPEQDLIIANGGALVRNQINARNVITTNGASSNNIITCPVYSTPVFTGKGPNAMTIEPFRFFTTNDKVTTISGTVFTGTVPRSFVVKIDGVTTPNTFKWSKDGGSTWDATRVPITAGKPQLLTEGIYIKFSQGTDLGLNDSWTFTAKPYLLME